MSESVKVLKDGFTFHVRALYGRSSGWDWLRPSWYWYGSILSTDSPDFENVPSHHIHTLVRNGGEGSGGRRALRGSLPDGAEINSAFFIICGQKSDRKQFSNEKFLRRYRNDIIILIDINTQMCLKTMSFRHRSIWMPISDLLTARKVISFRHRWGNCAVVTT